MLQFCVILVGIFFLYFSMSVCRYIALVCICSYVPSLCEKWRHTVDISQVNTVGRFSQFEAFSHEFFEFICFYWSLVFFWSLEKINRFFTLYTNIVQYMDSVYICIEFFEAKKNLIQYLIRKIGICVYMYIRKYDLHQKSFFCK